MSDQAHARVGPLAPKAAMWAARLRLSGGHTPWNPVRTCEETYQYFVPGFSLGRAASGS